MPFSLVCFAVAAAAVGRAAAAAIPDFPAEPPHLPPGPPTPPPYPPGKAPLPPPSAPPFPPAERICDSSGNCMERTCDASGNCHTKHCDSDGACYTTVCDQSGGCYTTVCDKEGNCYRLVCDTEKNCYRKVCDSDGNCYILVCDKEGNCWSKVCDAKGNCIRRASEADDKVSLPARDAALPAAVRPASLECYPGIPGGLACPPGHFLGFGKKGGCRTTTCETGQYTALRGITTFNACAERYQTRPARRMPAPVVMAAVGAGAAAAHGAVLFVPPVAATFAYARFRSKQEAAVAPSSEGAGQQFSPPKTRAGKGVHFAADVESGCISATERPPPHAVRKLRRRPDSLPVQ
ncbi:hypothetical protein EMIHUDRAFT_469409 [Emiliania huxleyi CCMP1516]|uniref:Dickkopf N-terminal cysteine-rich domain-containing protein n=2 Tax=Emiliania huxleyi TaxID=2903 RepID=A0A0D3JJX6_EMIH1|nr:hypothetical protein EMIHUDRAFT_469409 [Emiliania huxleyi CCMP1516]EOD23811.1 hypothetical protein EMIHUDRAFT_469409 [Emiliania huxleyi CCMP1516]|eukprot:XP_005776240.1 hypothetical protein EMIHUDRAFT_469409 [Emiliania huxleyi CCMP1516]